MGDVGAIFSFEAGWVEEVFYFFGHGAQVFRALLYAGPENAGLSF